MGGNVSIINRFTGVQTEADKIDISLFGRHFIKKEIIEFLREINLLSFGNFGVFIWNDFSIIENGFAFNGSTEAFMNDNIKDEDFIFIKPYLGDVDVTVPIEKKQILWDILQLIENEKITNNIKYLGNSKDSLNSISHQINTIVLLSKGANSISVNLQIDFELVHYKDNKPTKFSKFAHSSSWEDMKLSKYYKGLKGGVSHKYLIRSLFSATSTISNGIVVTPKSLPNKIRIAKKNGKPYHPRIKRFSVDMGVRDAYEVFKDEDGNDIFINGLRCYKEKQNSEYEQDVYKIASMIFTNIKRDEIKYFWSFNGMFYLIEKYLDFETKERTLKRFLDILWESDDSKNIAQELEKYDYKTDYNIKHSAFMYFIEHTKGLSNYKKIAEEMSEEYYKKYSNK